MVIDIYRFFSSPFTPPPHEQPGHYPYFFFSAGGEGGSIARKDDAYAHFGHVCRGGRGNQEPKEPAVCTEELRIELTTRVKTVKRDNNGKLKWKH